MDGLTLLSSLRAGTRGGISIIGAFSLTGVAGMSGLAMEMSHGYAVKVENQRVADAAALAAGLAYANDTTVTDATANQRILATAQSMAQANGLAAGTVLRGELAATTKRCDGTADTVTGRRNVCVTVRTAVPVSLTRVITSAVSYNVQAKGEATVVPGTTGGTTTPPNPDVCFLALESASSAAYGISVDGSSTIVGATGATGCDVLAVRGMYVGGSASITARYVKANSNVNINKDGNGKISASELWAGGTIVWPSWKSDAVPSVRYANRMSAIGDPLAAGSVQTALAKVTVASNYPIPPLPATVGAPPSASSSVDCNFSGTSKGSGCSIAATTSGSSGNWALPAGTTTVHNLTIDGSSTSLTLPAGSTLVVTGAFTLQGGSTSFKMPGSGSTLRVGGKLLFQGTSTATLGNATVHVGGDAEILNNGFAMGDGDYTVAGTARFGPGVKSLGVGARSFGRFVVDGSGKLTFGNGNLHVATDVAIGGSATFAMGTGIKTIGANAATGRSVFVDGTTTANFGTGNATLSGDLEVSGNTTVTFGAGDYWFGSRVPTTGVRCSTTTYDANCRTVNLIGGGNLTLGNGKLVMTGGIYSGGTSTLTLGSTANHYIRGNVQIDGGVSFGSGAYTIYGAFSKGASMSASGTNLSFFLHGPITLSGAASTDFGAGSTNTGEAIADILFASLTTLPSSYGGSTNSTYRGTLYVPNSAFTLSGSGRLGSTGCFVLIAKTITVTGSGSSGSKCSGVATAGTTTSGTTTPPTVSLIR